jgi:hypothetical protein
MIVLRSYYRRPKGKGTLLKRFATRYDKLAKTFFAALCLVSAFILIKNS